MAYIGKEPTPVPLVTADLTDNLVTLAKLASGTDGNLITYDASGNPAAVATGNDGQVLTSSGVGAAPVFEAAAGGGKIGQVLTVQNTAVESSTSTSFATISDFSIAITPAATSSKILVISSLQLSRLPQHCFFELMRDSTPIGIGDAAGSRERTSFNTFEEGASGTYACSTNEFTWLDSPSSTSEITYSWKWRITGDTIYLNRSEDTTDHVNYPRCASSITVMEVLA
jgi:hypothetical protein|tara:strand:- start:235 stop:915 length:681 start_codon:yes stop_codon:yes gene_type:complete